MWRDSNEKNESSLSTQALTNFILLIFCSKIKFLHFLKILGNNKFFEKKFLSYKAIQMKNLETSKSFQNQTSSTRLTFCVEIMFLKIFRKIFYFLRMISLYYLEKNHQNLCYYQDFWIKWARQSLLFCSSHPNRFYESSRSDYKPLKYVTIIINN